MTRKLPGISKLTCPSLGNVLSRKRLQQYLADTARRPVIWISGPPGSGKTILTASYIQDYRVPCLWYEVDERDEDPAVFFQFIGMAFQNTGPAEKGSPPQLRPEYLQNLSAFTKNYFDNLFQRLAANSALVLDNFQVISRKMFHSIIRDGLTQIPSGIKVIIISRHDPPPSFSRLLANGQMDVIGWEQLRLTLSESAEIGRLRTDHDLAPTFEEKVRFFHHQANGWVAGLVLMLEHSKFSTRTTEAISGDSHNVIFDYFAEEILNSVGDDLTSFLMKTSFLPRMTAPMAKTLSGSKNAARLLDTLDRKNHFTFKFERSSKTYYQYHDLFRKFLMEQAAIRLTPDDLAATGKKAAGILKHEGMNEDAALIMIRLRDWDALISLIQNTALQMVQQGKNDTLHRWVQSVPEAILGKTPWLVYWRGVSGIPINPRKSLEDLKNAFKSFQTSKEATGIYSAWSGIMDLFSMVFEAKFPEMSPWITLFDRIRQEHPVYPSKAVELQVCSSMVHGLIYCMMAHPDIPKYGERGLLLCREMRNAGLCIKIAADMAMYYTWMGEMVKARVMLDVVDGYNGSWEIPPIFQIGAKLVSATYHWVQTNHEKSRNTITEILCTAQETGLHGANFFAFGHGAANLLSQGDLVGADFYLKKMAALARRSKPHVSTFYYCLAGWRDYLQKEYHSAVRLFETGIELSLFYKEITISMRLSLYFGLAHGYFDTGDRSKALDQLSPLGEIARISKSRLFETAYLFTKARFLLLKRPENPDYPDGEKQIRESGLVALREAMGINREIGLFNFLPWFPRVMAELCVKALESGIETAYVKELIKRRGLMPETPPVHLKDWPFPIRIYTFGLFRLEKDGVPISFSRKVPKKPLEMLRLLVALGGRNVSEELVMDYLYPDAEGDKAHKALKTNLHRLRGLLKTKDGVLYQDGQFCLDPRFFWLDTWAFERLTELYKSQDTLAREAESGQQDPVKMVLELYKGDFLEDDVTTPWALGFREKFKSRFLRFIENAGRVLEQNEQWEKASQCYQKGLAVDETHEIYYCRMMICYKNLGRYADAHRLYARCRQVLSSVLGVEPSAETNAVYKSL